MIATVETTTMAPDNGQIKAPSWACNAEIIAACGRYFELQRHFNKYGEEDIPDDDPALPEQAALIKSLATMTATSAEAHAARAKVAMTIHPGAFQDLSRYECGALLQAMIRDLTTGAVA